MTTNPITKDGLYKAFLETHIKIQISCLGKSISQDHQYSQALPQIQKPGIILRKHMKETIKKPTPTSKT